MRELLTCVFPLFIFISGIITLITLFGPLLILFAVLMVILVAGMGLSKLVFKD
jgi:hypothetical protein